MFNAILNNNCPFTYLRDFSTLSFGICVLGDTERRVALYDMENDALEEDDTSNYMWDGEKLHAVLRIFEELV